MLKTKDKFKTVAAIFITTIFLGAPAFAQSAASKDGARLERPRDMNMFKVEPTIVDERHYSHSWNIRPNIFRYDAYSRNLLRADR
ncbi:hypothetical protein GC174_01610 [bacterium]|nr:hypothetical protein [bacterium]